MDTGEQIMIQLNDRVYDTLKWIDLIVLPAIGTAYAGLAQIWGFPYPEQITGTIMVICTLLGSLLGISSANYYKSTTVLPEDGE